MTDLITHNFWLHASTAARHTKGMQVIESPNIAYVNSGLSCDTFNVPLLKNGTQLTELELMEAWHHFRQKDFAHCIWITEEQLTDNVRSFFQKNQIIYGLATLPNYRGRGVGSALFSFALNQAKELEYKKVVLQASEEGIGIYQKMGFRVVTRFYEFAGILD